MTNFDDAIKEETKEHKAQWPQIPDHPYKILIIGGSRSGKAILLFNLYAKDPYKAKYQFVINK